MSKAPYRVAGLVGVLVVGALVAGRAGTATAEEPMATELDTTDAADYVGIWDLSMEFQGNPVNMILKIVDVDGKIGGTVDNERMPEPAAVTDASASEAGIKLTYPAMFGGNALTMNIEARLVDNALTGTLSEASGLFSTEIKGVKVSAEELEELAEEEESGEERRSRRRGGGFPTAKLTLDGDDIQISYPNLKRDSDDYEKLAGLKQGEIFEYVGGRATKLRTDAHLKFGDTIVEAENAAPNYPGVYSLWLKKVGDDDWRLVFNDHADIWGTQHEPKADAVEIPLKTGTPETEADTFTVELKEQGENAGKLRIAFGPMEWTADFTLAKH